MVSDDEIDRQEIVETELLRIVREEAHRTTDEQVSTLADIDNKAVRILRSNLLILSILLTGFSVIASESSRNLDGLVNPFFTVGVVFLLASTVLAAFTYTVSNKRSGMSGRDIRRLLDNDYSPEQNLRGILESYAMWIQYNFRMNTKNALLGTSVLLLLIYAIILLTIGVYNAFVTEVGIWGAFATVVVLSALTWRSGITDQLGRYRRYRDLDPAED
jgi:hypothetical protein